MNRQRHHQPNNARLENLFWFQTSLTLYALAKKVSSETLLNDDIPFELKLKSSSAFNSTSKLSSSFVARFHIKDKWLIRDSSAVVFSKSQSERAQIIRKLDIFKLSLNGRDHTVYIPANKLQAVKNVENINTFIKHAVHRGKYVKTYNALDFNYSKRKRTGIFMEGT